MIYAHCQILGFQAWIRTDWILILGLPFNENVVFGRWLLLSEPHVPPLYNTNPEGLPRVGKEMTHQSA